MQDGVEENVYRFNLGRLPWMRLFRSIALATDYRKVMLASFGLMVMWLGWDLLDRAFPTSAELTAPAVGHAWRFNEPLASIERLKNAFEHASDPALVPLAPFFGLFEIPSNNLRFVHAFAASLWSLLVWGVIGATIARMAAIEAANGTKVKPLVALRFALRHVGTVIGGPLIPLAGIAFFAGLCALFGLLYRIPGPIGATIAGVLAFLPLLAALLISLILVGLVAAWPLMIAGFGVEGNDSFDSLSRSFSYVQQRPQRYVVYVLIAWVLGAIGATLAGLFARLVVHIMVWALAFGAPDASVLFYFGTFTPSKTVPGAIHYAWLTIIALLAHGWVYSYFWSTASQIYLLMRYDVDEAPLNDFAAEEPTPPAESSTVATPAESKETDEGVSA